MVCPMYDEKNNNDTALTTSRQTRFEIIPAIDLINGECVRLEQGEYDKKTVFDRDPVAVARKWEAEGATRIHIVDLDGAKAGRPINTEIIKNIACQVNIPIQVGGGIRSLEHIKTTLAAGVERIILGTSLIKDPKFARAAIELFNPHIIVGLDTRNGKVAITGWTDTTSIDALQIAQTMEKFGAKRIIYTDIATDGMLSGPNLEALQSLSEKISISIIASGGIATIQNILDIVQLNRANIEGCIVGKALYANQFSLGNALSALNPLQA